MNILKLYIVICYNLVNSIQKGKPLDKHILFKCAYQGALFFLF